MNSCLNPYLELGVSPGVTLQELKHAYRQAVLRYHPDSALGQGNSLKFHAVTEAYQQLRGMLETRGKMFQSPTSSRFSSVRSDYFQKERTHAQQRQTNFHSQQAQQARPTIDQKTANLSIAELLKSLQYSSNPYVQMLAAEAIAKKRDHTVYPILSKMISNADEHLQIAILYALGQNGLHEVRKYLFPFIHAKTVEISVNAIRSLERIDPKYRSAVLKELRRTSHSIWERWGQSLKNLRSLSVEQECGKLGDLLIRKQKVTEEQLEITLLLQRRFPLLLGQLMRHLEYLNVNELQSLLSAQKKCKYDGS